MLIFLPLVLILLAYYCNKGIRVNSILIYVGSIILASLSIVLYDEVPFVYIANGQVGLAILLTVMFTGAIPKGSTIKKQLRYVRKEYSVLAFIFLTPHALLSIYDLFLGTGYLELFGLITYLLMIPLLLTSVSDIKCKIKTSTWIKTHKLAYLLYFLLFAHLFTTSSIIYKGFYSILFGTYIFMKLYFYYIKRYKFLTSLLITVILVVSFGYLSIEEIDYNYDYIDYLEGSSFNDGTYEGVSNGYRGIDTKVYVTIKDNVIQNITLDECGCTPNADNGFYLNSAYETSNNIVYANRTDIDAISGATATSISINDAVINALTKAKK